MLQPKHLPVVLRFASAKKQQQQLPGLLVFHISSQAGSKRSYLRAIFLDDCYVGLGIIGNL